MSLDRFGIPGFNFESENEEAGNDMMMDTSSSSTCNLTAVLTLANMPCFS